MKKLENSVTLMLFIFQIILIVGVCIDTTLVSIGDMVILGAVMISYHMIYSK